MCEVTESTLNMIMTFVSQKNKLLGIVAAIILFGCLPFAVFAQESVSFSVSPTIYDMTANPGQMWQSTVRIINPNPYELALSVTPSNFVPKDEDGIPQFIPLGEPTSENTSLAEWIQTEKEIIIGPEQTLELPFVINVPEDATPGGHYAALMISTKPAEPKGNGQVQTSQVISSLIFLRVTGDITEQGTIRSFRSADYFLSKPQTRFEIRVENKGNIHMQPQGEIKIYNMWGRERGSIPINQQTMLGNVLPQSVRKFSFEWSSEWSITDIGRYTAKVTLAYGKEERQFLSADTAFWIIPWKILLLMFLVIGGLISIVTWAIKLYVRHVLVMAGVHPAELVKQQVKTPDVKPKRSKAVIQAKDIAAPIRVSILDLRSKLKQRNGPWSNTFIIYLKFVKTYWKFFAGAGAALVLVGSTVWFVSGALTPNRAYEIKDPTSGEILSKSDDEPQALQNGLGTPVTLVNRTADLELIKKVSDMVTVAGFVVATTTQESGAPEERTVIVYNPAVSEPALLLSRTLNNALLSAFTSTATSTDKLVVYVGKDALEAQ
jgi:LytR cell envelope-related transcriptional attenuator